MDQQQQDKLFQNIEIEPQAKSFLEPLLKWAKITSLVGLVSVALSVISAIIKAKGAGTGLYAAALGGSLFFTIPIAVVLVLINIFLLRFANSAKLGIDTMSQQHFNQGISNLRYYFKTIGIFIIVLFCLVVLVLIAFLIGFGSR